DALVPGGAAEPSLGRGDGGLGDLSRPGAAFDQPNDLGPFACPRQVAESDVAHRLQLLGTPGGMMLRSGSRLTRLRPYFLGRQRCRGRADRRRGGTLDTF